MLPGTLRERVTASSYSSPALLGPEASCPLFPRDPRVTTALRLLAYGPAPLPKAVSSPVAESCGPKERNNRGYATGLQDRALVFGRALEDEVILLFDPTEVLFHVPDNLLNRRVG